MVSWLIKLVVKIQSSSSYTIDVDELDAKNRYLRAAMKLPSYGATLAVARVCPCSRTEMFGVDVLCVRNKFLTKLMNSKYSLGSMLMQSLSCNRLQMYVMLIIDELGQGINVRF